MHEIINFSLIRPLIIAIAMLNLTREIAYASTVTCQIENNRYCIINGTVSATTEKDFVIEAIENAADITKFEVKTASQLKIMPTQIFQMFPNLEDLLLNSAEIKDLTADRFVNATNLINLYLNFNKLENITAGVFPIASKLEEIHMASNHIKFVQPKSFENLTYLNTIDLQNNSIEIIHQNTFAGLQSLTFLYLNMNCIKVIERDAFNLSNLRELYLSQNKIRELPANIFVQSPKLKEIDLEGNQLIGIDNIFENCSELHTIALGNNPLFLDLNLTKFSTYPSLVYLSLENTGINITAIGEPTIRSSSSKVVFLNLSSNNLSDPDIFKRLTIFNKLEELQLVNNNFTHFNDPQEFKTWFPNLEYLPIINNQNQLLSKWILNNTDNFRKSNIRTILNYD